MTDITKCPTCDIIATTESFWESHQTMQDGRIWCIKSRTKRVEEMTTAIVNRHRANIKSTFGNKKRHRQ